MDQLKSSDIPTSLGANTRANVPLAKRPLSIEFWVGLFTAAGVAAAAYLAVGLAGVNLFESNNYIVKAVFDNISGLKMGASVELAGVQVGEVVNIELDDPRAIITMNINTGLLVRDDDVFQIRTKGIIGDRYVKISRGGSDSYIKPGGKTTETESVVDIEEIIGKLVHGISGDDKDKDKEKSDSEKS